jgi:hypothetical protein
MEGRKAFHCMASSWKNNDRDFCLVPTGKLHHALGAGREGHPSVGQIKLVGRWVLYTQGEQTLPASHMWLSFSL